MKQKLSNEGATKNDLVLLKEDILSEVDTKAKGYRDDVLNKLDEIVGELQTIREEQVMSVGQYRNHEERIEKLEKLQGIHQ